MEKEVSKEIELSLKFDLQHQLSKPKDFKSIDVDDIWMRRERIHCLNIEELYDGFELYVKEDAIKDAWVKLLSKSEDFKLLNIDDNGYSDWRCRKYIHSSKLDDLSSRVKRGSKFKSGSDLEYRPKSIKNLESNNGWIKINSSKDLPKSNGLFWTLRRNIAKAMYVEVFNDLDEDYWLSTYTHYQIIERPKDLPLY